MDPSGRKVREDALFRLANAQFGLLRRDQLRAAPLTPTEIRGRVADRRLTRLGAQVYCLGHTALVPQGVWLAAQWACPGCALSHVTAARFHGWTIDAPDDTIHLTTAGTIRSRAGIVVHRTRHLDPVDVLDAHPLWVTRVPRTLVDLADVLPWPSYRAVADSLPHLRTDAIRAAQTRTPNRRGAPLVTRLIEADDTHTRSEFERRFLRFLRARRLPHPDDLNVHVAGHRADAVFRAQRLVVELDGRAYHERRAQMRADRHRDLDYQLAGFVILRLVWDDLHADGAAATARRMRRVLRARGSASGDLET